MIKTKLVVEGVGLPPELDAEALYAGCEDAFLGGYHDDADLDIFRHGMRTVCNVLGNGGELNLSRPHVAFLLALKLDEWERHTKRPPTVEEWRRDRPRRFWAASLADALGIADPEVRAECLSGLLAAMAARLTHVGQDHAIRRALGMTVEPGTLALAFQTSAGDWVVMCPKTAVQARPGITDPIEARAAIYAEVTHA
jgi:hypothetical protein